MFVLNVSMTVFYTVIKYMCQWRSPNANTNKETLFNITVKCNKQQIEAIFDKTEGKRINYITNN